MDRVKIGNTFRTIRVELRLRQSDVAKRAGLSQQTVSDLECGRFGRLSIDAYCRIAETIGRNDRRSAVRSAGRELEPGAETEK